MKFKGIIGAAAVTVAVIVIGGCAAGMDSKSETQYMSDTYSTPAATSTYTTPTPIVTPSKTVNLESKTTSSTNVTTMKLAWDYMSPSEQDATRDGWQLAKDYDMEDIYLESYVSTLKEFDVNVTKSEARQFLNWTLNN